MCMFLYALDYNGLVCSCFFFVKDTATTEIYTYLHTLALHDALPISAPWNLPSRLFQFPIEVIRAEQDEPRKIGLRHPLLAAHPFVQHERMGGKRSEEHTSELQSLMRISYAVFCLKKKTNKKQKKIQD